MHYDFNTYLDRRHTDSVKWDHIPDNPAAIPMWVADMDFRCPEPVIAALREKVDFGVFAYTATPPAFREATARWQRVRHGWDLGDAAVIPITSVVPALYTAVAAFTKPGQKVILQRPVYGPFTGAIEQQGRVVSNNALRLECGRYTMDFADLERRAADPDAKLMFLCNPHNPVGLVFTREELEQVAEICTRNGVVLFSDEIHADFQYPGQSHIPILSLTPHLAQCCLTAIAPSKTFNLAAMKAAAVLSSNPDLAEPFQKALALNHADNLNMLGVYAYIAAYQHGDEYLDQLLQHLGGNVDCLRKRLAAEMPRIRLIEPEGTYLMWLDCRDLGMDQAKLHAFFTWEAGVALNDGDWFGPEGEGFVRMNLACTRGTLNRALDQIAAAYRRL